MPLWCEALCCGVHQRTRAVRGIDLAKVYALMEETSSESHNLGTRLTPQKCVIEVSMQYSGGLQGSARASWRKRHLRQQRWKVSR